MERTITSATDTAPQQQEGDPSDQHLRWIRDALSAAPAAAAPEAAPVRIFHDAFHPSYVDLPIVA